jgi:DNA-binding response OmpR family regulator
MSDDEKKILVVEDNLNGRMALVKFLQMNEYQCDEAEDGWKGIEKIRNTPYDLILLDIMLPYYDGFTILEMMQEENITVPVIVTSALDGKEHIQRAKDLGARDYFVKPLQFITVQKRISEILDNPTNS